MTDLNYGVLSTNVTTLRAMLNRARARADEAARDHDAEVGDLQDRLDDARRCIAAMENNHAWELTARNARIIELELKLKVRDNQIEEAEKEITKLRASLQRQADDAKACTGGLVHDEFAYCPVHDRR